MKRFALFYSRHFPHFLQILISKIFSIFFRLPISRLIIPPYCKMYGLDQPYLEQFESSRNQKNYSSFADFFKRRYRTALIVAGALIWPCEGYVCDWGLIDEIQISDLKGDIVDVDEIFQTDRKNIKNHYFVNVFLHNHNYHRVHAPTDGVIKSIKSVRGGLSFLRPWLYEKESRSYPAHHNERTVFEIEDPQQKTWWITLVGGFGVGTIKLTSEVLVGAHVNVGQEIAWFELGSTVCIAAPCTIHVERYLQSVHAGQVLTYAPRSYKNEEPVENLI